MGSRCKVSGAVLDLYAPYDYAIPANKLMEVTVDLSGVKNVDNTGVLLGVEYPDSGTTLRDIIVQHTYGGTDSFFKLKYEALPSITSGTDALSVNIKPLTFVENWTKNFLHVKIAGKISAYDDGADANRILIEIPTGTTQYKKDLIDGATNNSGKKLLC
jgi:hypothetical protein